MTHRLARRLLRLYPRAWRTRYEGEVLALVEQSGLSILEAIDLLRGAAVEHLRTTSNATLTYLGQTWLERNTNSGPGPWPGLALAAAVGGVIELVSKTAGPLLTRTWPALSTREEFLVLAPSWLCFAGMSRLVALRPTRLPRRNDAEFVAKVDAYPLPPLNRWVALFWSYRPMSADERFRNHQALMRVSEAAAWMSLAFAARIVLERVLGGAPVWRSLEASICTGLFIVAIASAAVRGRRFGIAPPVPKT